MFSTSFIAVYAHLVGAAGEAVADGKADAVIGEHHFPLSQVDLVRRVEAQLLGCEAAYDEQTAAGYLSEYSDSDIPDDSKVNILALQLEAFSDFTTLGLDELEYIYADYHALEDESYTGDLITNIFAGGTVDTERCFLTGYTRLRDYRQNTNSYVWYLRQQGYTVNGSHPS